MINEYVAKIAAERGQRPASQTQYMLMKFGVTGLTGRELDAARTRLRGMVSASSANRIMACVRSYLHWLRATERAQVSRETVADVLKPFREERPKIELPDNAQLRKLLELAMGMRRNRASRMRFIAFTLFAGLRPGEAELVQPADLKRDYIIVKATKTGVERHAYVTHSAVLRPLMLRLAVLPRIMPAKPRLWLSAAFREAGWSSDTRNTLRKLCVSFCACSGKFTEWQMSQQFGHSQVVSVEHYRDRAVLGMFKQGDCIEEWMGLGDMVPALKDAVIGS